MKKLCLSVSVVIGLLGGVQADQFTIKGRDLVRPDANGASLAFGAGEIIAFSSYATASLAGPYPEKYAKLPVILASTGQADSLYVTSTASADRQILTVDGLDENWERQIKTTTLNGSIMTRVGGSGVYWRRVNFASLSSPATGTVRIVHGASSLYYDSTKVVSLIRVGQSSAQIAMFSTWKNFEGAIQYWTFDPMKRGAGATPDTAWGAAGILARTQADTSWKVLYSRGFIQGKPMDIQFVQTIPILGKTDLYVAAGVTSAAVEIFTNLGLGGQ